MNAIYWHMNGTLGGANLHPGVNLLPGANLHPGANCAHEHGFSRLVKSLSMKVFCFCLKTPKACFLVIVLYALYTVPA